jgi:hypothetical protein
MIRAYLREASRESSSDLAPVTTIFPEAKIKAVVFGSRIRMMTAAKRYECNVSEGGGETDMHIYLGVVLCITSVHGNGLQIKTTSEIDGSDNVPAGSEKTR